MSGLTKRIIVRVIKDTSNQSGNYINNNQHRDKEIEQTIIRDVINSIDLRKGRLNKENEKVSN